MRNVGIAVSIVSWACVLQTEASIAQIVPVTNVEIRMVKTSAGRPLRVTAETRNPNDFAVRDIEVDCTIKDRSGKNVATYTSVIHGIFLPNQRTTTPNLDIGAWPETGYAALCVSKRGTRVTQAGAPAPAPPGSAQPAESSATRPAAHPRPPPAGQ